MARGELFALSTRGRLLRINADSGFITPIGTGVKLPQARTFGFDFNPTVDRIRVVGDRGDNFRLHPDTGALVDGQPDVEGVQPDSPLHGLEGLKHMESAIVPGIYDQALADEDVRVGTEEAYEMTRRLAQEEGLLVGISSGGNLAGALRVARTASDAVFVIIFPDGGEKYLSERFWDEGAASGSGAASEAERQ